MSKKEKQFWPIEGVTRSEVIKSQNDTRFNFLRTHRARRLMILGISGMTVLALCAPLVAPQIPNLIALLGTLLLLAGYLLIRTSVRHIADSPDELLDERQIALRDRSYLHAYRILSGIVTLVLVILFIRIDFSASNFDVSTIMGPESWIGLIFLMGGLPSMVVAWLDKGEDEI